MGRRLSEVQRQHLVHRVRLLGHQRGLTSDAAIAAASGLAPTAVRDLERSVQGPTLSSLLGLCQGLRVYSLDQLLGFSAARFFTQLEEVESALGTGASASLARQVAEPSIGT